MTRTLGRITDDMHVLQTEISELNARVKELQGRYDVLERELIETADAQGVSSGAGKSGKFLVRPKIVPHVKDWDAFYKFIHRKRYFHLLHRRASATGCKELFDQGQPIPGVEPFETREVLLRSA